MNVAVGTLLDPAAAAHEDATTRVNAWRGRCLASFARAEMAVSEALLSLAATREDIALPHMFGQRVTALRSAVATRDEGRELEAALAAFAMHLPLRVFLTHGDVQVTLDRTGRWQVVLTVLALKRGDGERSFLVVDEEEAQEIARALGRDRQRLVTRLVQWRTTSPAKAELIGLRAGTIRR